MATPSGKLATNVREVARKVRGQPTSDNEPVARCGPLVMNTAEEIHQAFADYQAGRL